MLLFVLQIYISVCRENPPRSAVSRNHLPDFFTVSQQLSFLSTLIMPYRFLYAFFQDQQSKGAHKWYPKQLQPSTIALLSQIK